MNLPPTRAGRDPVLDARLKVLGVRRQRVHQSVGRWNFVVPCGDQECDLCYPRRPRRRHGTLRR